MSTRLARSIHRQKGDDDLSTGERVLTIGRDPDNDLTLDDPRVSGHHARVVAHDGRTVVEDLGSSNGTSIGRLGHRAERASLAPSDTVFFGPVAVPAVTLLRRLGIEVTESAEGSWIEARDLSIVAGGKRLIDDISLTVAPGELVGMMGPSGAGKTTLLNILAGLTPPTTGRVSFDGLGLYRNHARFRRSIGYVPQDDVMHGELTVRNALRYAARLRLPPSVGRTALERRIDQILEQLGISGIDDVLIGSPVKKGISGGQRKRVNLAMELLTDPTVLFLDEPTSGLSSEDALVVMKVLRKLADQGKTVLLTLHQPSLEAYQKLDRLILLGKDAQSSEPGRLVYAGSAWRGALEHFAPRELEHPKPSPDAVLRELGQQPVARWLDRWQRSPERAAAERPSGMKDRAGRKVHEPPPGPGPIRQWWTLVRRMLTIRLRDRWTTLVHLAQAPLIAALVVMIWGQGSTLPAELTAASWRSSTAAVSTSIFLAVVAAIWFGCSNAAREIVAEWSVFRRERMVSLGLVPYVASKVTVLGGLCSIQCAVLLVIVVHGCGLQAAWSSLYVPLLLAALVGTALGLALSAMAPSSEVAIYLVPLVLLPMVMLGGALKPIPEMPATARVVAHALPSQWAFEGMLGAEAGARPPLPLPDLSSAATRRGDGADTPRYDVAERHFPRASRASHDLVLGALGSGFLLLTIAILAVLVIRDVRP